MTKHNFKAIHDIHTFQVCHNEVYLGGLDEHGEDITLVFNAFELLEWLHIDEIRASVLKYVNDINKEEHPDIKALKDVDEVIDRVWEEGTKAKDIQEDEEEIQISCCGDEITGALKDIQMCPTCKEHL